MGRGDRVGYRIGLGGAVLAVREGRLMGICILVFAVFSGQLFPAALKPWHAKNSRNSPEMSSSDNEHGKNRCRFVPGLYAQYMAALCYSHTYILYSTYVYIKPHLGIWQL